MPYNGNNPQQMSWPGSNAVYTPPGCIPEHLPHGFSPLNNHSANNTVSMGNTNNFPRPSIPNNTGQMPWPGSNGGYTPPNRIPPHHSSPFSDHSANIGSDGSGSPSHRNNYCVRCVPGGPLCPCYARAQDKLLRRDMGIQVDMSDLASSKYTKEEYFTEGSEACKLLSVSEIIWSRNRILRETWKGVVFQCFSIISII